MKYSASLLLLLVANGISLKLEVPNLLFSPADENCAALNVEQQCNEDLSCEIVKISEDLLTNAATINIMGCNNTLARDNSRVDSITDEDGYSYAPFVGTDCEALFTYKSVDGSLKVMGEVEMVLNEIVFDIEPSKPARCHVWKEAVRNSFGDEALTDEFVSMSDYDRDSSNAVLLQQGIEDNATIVTYSFKAYYTNNFALVTEDPDLYFHNMMALTNEGYKNSKIPLRMKLACTEHMDIDDGDNLLGRFKGSASLKNLRGGADATGIWASTAGSLCGLAGVGGDGGVQSVVMISKQCSYETVGHEIGHNFGIWHKSTWNGDNYRTIMTAYSGAINYYSNPMVQYEGKPMGNATMDSAKLVTRRRFLMAAHSQEDKCIPRPNPPNPVFRPVLATQMSVLPTVFKILNGESCTGGEASLPLSVTLLSEAGANCTFTAPSSPLSPGSLTAVSDLGECAFTDFTNGINRMKFQGNNFSGCYANFELELENGSRYTCSSIEYSIALGNSCSTVVTA